MFGLALSAVLLAHPKMHSTIARRDCDIQEPPTVSDW